MVYTYDVHWAASDVSWASRWDAYLKMPGGRVHWFSILNSLMVVLVMSSIVAMIMMRTIRRDLARYEGLLGDTGACSRVLQVCKMLLGAAFRKQQQQRQQQQQHETASWATGAFSEA